MANLFIEHFDKIKSGSDFVILMQDYLNERCVDFVTFNDYVNFANVVLDVEVSINLTTSEYVTYNFVDNITGLEHISENRVLKTNFFDNNLSDVDINEFVTELEGFFIKRSFIDLSQYDVDAYTLVHYVTDGALQDFDLLQGTVIGDIPIIDENNVVAVYETFKSACLSSYKRTVNELLDKLGSQLNNINLLQGIEQYIVETFLFDYLQCREFRTRRKGITSLIPQIPYLGAFYVYDFRGDKIVFDCTNEKNILENLKRLY